MRSRPSVLFYCQHARGMGHLVRSLVLARAMARQFRVVFLNGGVFPDHICVPDDIEFRHLPPLGFDEKSQLLSLAAEYNVAQACAARRAIILHELRSLEPDVLFIELFPFGRKKFSDELLPLLARAHVMPDRPLIFCSVRELLVTGRDNQRAHDDRAARILNEFFDAVLVHGDAEFAQLDETFRPLEPLKVPVHYTGFVCSKTPPGATRKIERTEIVVSAGGGLVGGQLLKTAIAAHKIAWPQLQRPMKIIGGPFLPQQDWRDITALAKDTPALTLIRSVPGLQSELCGAALSISQCGYNMAMDILASATPALVVPYVGDGETEQTDRAQRLARLGLLQSITPAGLSPLTLAEAMRGMLTFAPRKSVLNLDGAERTVKRLRAALRNTAALPAARLAGGIV